jgi:hypothetical protein
VKLAPGVALPHKDYTNRPTYLIVLDGKLNIATNNHKQALEKSPPVDLVNNKDASINIDSSTHSAKYLIMEIWDPADVNAL